MAVDAAAGQMTLTTAVALVGVLGVGAQWIAWRFKLPAIVVMLAAGILVGPVFGIFDPAVHIGPIADKMVSIAVAVILFEGGLTLDFRKLGDARAGVTRLVAIGAPLGWFLSSVALHYVGGLSWASSTVFGGIMIVTGPTVIAPLLRQARLAGRPAQLLQWEAILADPVGALAAVFAFGIVLIRQDALHLESGVMQFVLGTVAALALGFCAGLLIAVSFRRGWVPEYMKVPVLFVLLLAVFALSEALLHESGLLAVTVMGVVIANSDLPSFDEIRRFKEHATILLVSGVFILLSASMDFATLAQMNWRMLAFIVTIVAVVRPLTVHLSLAGSDIPMKERWLIALTGPRGVVLVAVAGLFGERLADAGIADGAMIPPLAFVLVVVTVVLHGFTLAPLARKLGLAETDAPGALIVGGSRFTTALAEALRKANVPVLVADPNRRHIMAARRLGIPTFYGDIMSEAAEHMVEFLSYGHLVAATDNDAYNTLVATEFGAELGRGKVWQVARANAEKSRHALPTQLGGRIFLKGKSFEDLEEMMVRGWTLRQTRLTEEYPQASWREKRPEALIVAYVDPKDQFAMFEGGEDPALPAGTRVIALVPPEAVAEAAA